MAASIFLDALNVFQLFPQLFSRGWLSTEPGTGHLSLASVSELPS